MRKGRSRVAASIPGRLRPSLAVAAPVEEEVSLSLLILVLGFFFSVRIFLVLGFSVNLGIFILVLY